MRIVIPGGTIAGTWISALEGSDICINLAGRSVNCSAITFSPENRTR